MEKVGNSSLWVEKYRPQTTEDVIAPEYIKIFFQKIIQSGEMPNLIFSGSAGLGKTSSARALGNDLGMDIKYINGSLETSIDNIRYTVKTFAATNSLMGNQKLVILDEADRMSPQALESLKVILEETSDVTRFIFCTNNLQKMIEPLQSRCGLVSFNYGSKYTKELMIQYLKRIRFILEREQVEFSDQLLAGFIQKLFPDFRKMINELQKYVKIAGRVDEGILALTNDSGFEDLMELIKGKKFEKMRKLCSEIDADTFWSTFYAGMNGLFVDAYKPELILMMNPYQVNHSTCIDKEINLVAFCTELMMNAKWK